MVEQQHADLLTKDSASLACAFPRYAKVTHNTQHKHKQTRNTQHATKEGGA
jgi:hypothetical protein